MFKDENAEKIIARLGEKGFAAYYVGGCVRDGIMERDIHDIDIAAVSLPDETMQVFKGETIIPTGLKHGTVTVVLGGSQYEITTFRADGRYSDNRHPESVEFVGRIESDLSRRDFTINAMAMDISGNIIDPFGGKEDISRKLIRCVGDPKKRFSEDALRILRAMRFASQLGFGIEENTAAAMLELRGGLANISAERIREELDKLLCGENCADVLLRFKDIIGQIIPEFKRCFGFQQHSRYHKYDVYEHIVRAVEAAPRESLVLRRTMFFHDIAKPLVFAQDENGEGHFKGHAQLGAEMTEKIMERLRYDKKTIKLTCALIDRHSDTISTEKQIRRLAAKLGNDAFFLLMEVKKADNLAKNEFTFAENASFDQYADRLRELIAEESCFSLRQLAVNGRDLMQIGIYGQQIGKILNTLLGLVIDGELPNDREKLMERAAKEAEL